MGVEGHVADLVDHEQWDEAQPLELCLEGAVAFVLGEAADPFGGGGEQDAVAGQAGRR